ncbi:MAG TPA: SPOR domain-containing protein [Gemmatimonadaceae bacterium]|nr:SPOR domain-containing protein [Gemmatimonadaceae bacterium]
MRRFTPFLFALSLAASASAQSTDTAAAPDTVFTRIQQLAANGQGDAARALAQQAVESAPTASQRFVEALYWRAVVAATAADAERDLRTIIVDYPVSPYSTDALMRLAQLEMTRGENDKAMSHLQRVVTEHPDSPDRARASFWMARVAFQQGQSAQACRQLADASRTAADSNIELKNQIEYWQGRCTGVDTLAKASRADSGGKGAAGAATGAAATKAAPAPAPSAASATKPMWTVQVAAYKSKSSADALVKSLKDRGYDARTYGTIAPFRVRIGRYDTRAKAESAAEKMNTKKITGFVTEAESQ